MHFKKFARFCRYEKYFDTTYKYYTLTKYTKYISIFFKLLKNTHTHKHIYIYISGINIIIL